jgi:hypothetical protein
MNFGVTKIAAALAAAVSARVSRVARWYVFIPKIQICKILQNYIDIWYISW